MKTFFKTIAIALGCMASGAWAALPNQPATDPMTIGPDLDYGAFAAVTTIDYGGGVLFDDDERAVAWDNFTLSNAYNIDGLCWTGIYSERFPDSAVSETDFIIRILPDNGGSPDLGATGYSWTLDGGLAGTSGPDVTVSAPLGYTSPTTTTNPQGGGEAFHYEASLSTETLAAGNYWISITAAQEFDTPAPAFDPQWMWHVGDGPDDGFYAYDHIFPAGTTDIGEFFADKDLAFELKGSVVPEPSSIVMALAGTLSLGLFRRKRQ